MKKHFRILAVFLIVFMVLPLSLSAHSGRTDSSGGHHDYNSVSGLGSYHYHHGYGPHLHPNGVCPYDSAYTSVINNSMISTTPTAKSYVPVSVIVNGKTLSDQGLLIDSKTYIPLREAMESVGCSVSWDGNIKTATINSSAGSSQKAINDLEIYRLTNQLLNSASNKISSMDVCISNPYITTSFDSDYEEKESNEIQGICVSYSTSIQPDLQKALFDIYWNLYKATEYYNQDKQTGSLNIDNAGNNYFTYSKLFWDNYNYVNENINEIYSSALQTI